MSVPDDRSLSGLIRGWLLAPLTNQIAQLEDRLMASEAENYAQLTATVADVKTAFASQRTEIEQLRAALEQASADALRQVDEALAADSEHDAEAIAAVDASLRELVPGQAVEVPADTPVDGTGDAAPVDETLPVDEA